MEQARVEDRIREADRVDPDVDHRSQSYSGDVTPPREEGPTSGTSRV